MIIVDTDADAVDDIKKAIKIFQYDCEAVIYSSGKKCLNDLTSNKVHEAIVVGLKLSDMSGFELVKQIREDYDIPIIFVSHDKDIKLLEKALDSGANSYIIKPFNKNIFAASLKAIIRRREWESQFNKE
ncbi:MAG: response regulator [Dehalococcoidales bacterium]|nr:response regulator [Dehalococcoidales bacterium]